MKGESLVKLNVLRDKLGSIERIIDEAKLPVYMKQGFYEACEVVMREVLDEYEKRLINLGKMR